MNRSVAKYSQGGNSVVEWSTITPETTSQNLMVLHIEKNRSSTLIGGAALLRSNDRRTQVICRSYEGQSKTYVQVSIPRECLYRLHQHGETEVTLLSTQKIWKHLLSAGCKLHWTIAPAQADIQHIRNEGMRISIARSRHPLQLQARRLAKIARTRRIHTHL